MEKSTAVQLNEEELKFLAAQFVEGAPKVDLDEDARKVLEEKLVMGVGQLWGFKPKAVFQKVADNVQGPRKGAIAFCSRGMLGLITSDKPEKITYEDGGSAEAWTGIHLRSEPGSPWSSRNPIVIGHVDNFGEAPT